MSDYLLKKFMKTMQREVNTKQELDGKAGWREIKRSLSSRFRLTSKDIEIIASELKKNKKLKMGRSKRNRISMELKGKW